MSEPYDRDPRATARVVSEALRRGQRRRRAWHFGVGVLTAATLVVVGVVVGLAASGAFRGGHGTHVSILPSATSTTAPPKHPTTTAPSTRASSTTQASTSACQAKQLRLTLTMQSGSMGTGLAQVIVQNTSASSCRLDGYPLVTLANTSGRTSGQSTDTTPGMAPNPPLGTEPAPATIELRTNGHAVFWFTWQDNPVGSQTDANCVKPARESITTPGSSEPVALSQPLNTLACSAPLVEPIEAAGFVPNGLRGGP